MQTFYVTFGTGYGEAPDREVHPYLPGVTGDHYLRVVAQNEEQARALVFAVLDCRWAFIYTEDDFRRERFPAGKFGSIEFRLAKEN